MYKKLIIDRCVDCKHCQVMLESAFENKLGCYKTDTPKEIRNERIIPSWFLLEHG